MRRPSWRRVWSRAGRLRFQQVEEEVRGADCRQRVVANDSVILGEVKRQRRLEVVECSKWVMACLGSYCFGLLWFCR
ncbi:hypothetical protein ACFX2I_028735 [Malus domestica]